jgi:hypothetical protein
MDRSQEGTANYVSMAPPTHRWTKELKLIRGRAAFAEIAVAANVWDPKRIEEAVFVANNKDTPFGEPTNKFGRMISEGAAPEGPTIEAVNKAFPSCDIPYWLGHPLFYLLDENQDALAARRYAFDSLAGPLRMEVWQDAVGDAPWTGKTLRNLSGRAIEDLLEGPIARHLDHLDDLDHLKHTERRIELVEQQASSEEVDGSHSQKVSYGRKQGQISQTMRSEQSGQLKHIEVLTLATALAKLARSTEELSASARAARSIWSIFPRVVVQYPQLLFTWKTFANLYATQIWRPMNKICTQEFGASADPADRVMDAIAIAEKLQMRLPPLKHIR